MAYSHWFWIMVECQISFPYKKIMYFVGMCMEQRILRSQMATQEQETTTRSSTKNKKVPTIEEGKERKGREVFL